MQLCCKIHRLSCVRDLVHMHDSMGSGVRGGWAELNYQCVAFN